LTFLLNINKNIFILILIKMSIKNTNTKFNLINNRIKYGTDGGINVDAGALFVNPTNGRVGINTLNPQYNLDICGNININGLYNYYGNNINSQFYPSVNTYSSGSKALASWSGTGQGDSPRSVVWSPELGLFALCSNTVNSTSIWTSFDGQNWIARTTPSYGAWDITWARSVTSLGSGLFVAVSSNGVMTSTNGITWSDGGTITANNWVGITWSQDKQLFVAVARDATVNSNTVMVSSNGSTWVQYTPPLNCQSICYSKELGLFVAIGDSGIMTSSNGINWNITIIFSSSNGNVIWSPQLGLFLACNILNSSGNYGFRISSDGSNWSSISTPLDGIDTRAISWSAELGMFVAMGNGSSGVVYSPNGINWTSASNSLGATRRMTWSPELGIFVSVINFGTRTQCSSLKGRPPTSYNVFDSSYNNIRENGLWTFQSFGRGVPVTKNTNFTAQPGENWTIVDNSSSTVLVTLQTALQWPGEEITIKTIQARAVNSASSNVVPINSSTPGTAILPATAGSWATLVSDGTNWVIVSS
jgi:hypothetical protein